MQRYQLDYVMLKLRHRNSVKNVHRLPDADADTDHKFIIYW